MLSEETLAYGERAMRALLGVDALYREESGDEDGLAVLNLDTDGEFAPEPYGSYADAREGFAALGADAAMLPEPDRRTYYDQLCHSTLAFIRWRTKGLSFESQLHDFLHVPTGPAREEEIEVIRTALGSLLSRLGYGDDLTAACTAWESHHRVSKKDVAGVLSGLMDEAWDLTEARLFEIPAPRSDAMRIETVTGAAFNARCDYARRRVEINVDPILTRPALKHLAVHEGLPGHYAQFKLRETLFREGLAPADVLLSIVNSASSSVFEGIADAGMAMIDWVDDDDRVQALLNRHRAAIGTGAAWRLHAEGLGIEDATDWLRSQALIGGEGWVENRMAFIAAPARAVLIWSYWLGEPAVAPLWDAVPEPDRPAFLRFLYGRMHSAASVSMFREAGA